MSSSFCSQSSNKSVKGQCNIGIFLSRKSENLEEKNYKVLLLSQALVHVSTAYSNAPRSHIEERVYSPPYDPDSIIRCAKMLPPETVDVIAETLQVQQIENHRYCKYCGLAFTRLRVFSYAGFIK